MKGNNWFHFQTLNSTLKQICFKQWASVSYDRTISEAKKVSLYTTKRSKPSNESFPHHTKIKPAQHHPLQTWWNTKRNCMAPYTLLDRLIPRDLQTLQNSIDPNNLCPQCIMLLTIIQTTTMIQTTWFSNTKSHCKLYILLSPSGIVKRQRK